MRLHFIFLIFVCVMTYDNKMITEITENTVLYPQLKRQNSSFIAPCTEIAKQQVSETQNLLDREAQHVSYQHKDLHQKKEATKERTQAMLAGRQKVNETTCIHTLLTFHPV